MFSLIAFGVVAVIVVVFLLTFNVRSLSQGQAQPNYVEPSKEIEPFQEEDHVPENNLVSAAERINPIYEKDKPEKAEKVPSEIKRELEAVVMLDKDYRNGLRRFQTQESLKSTESVKPRRNDAEYRSALRSMAKQKK